jgi:hypothetical protein
MPDEGPFGETFFDASDRAMTGALLVKRSFGGWVESVVTVFTQRFFEGGFESWLAARCRVGVDFLFAGGMRNGPSGLKPAS